MYICTVSHIVFHLKMEITMTAIIVKTLINPTVMANASRATTREWEQTSKSSHRALQTWRSISQQNPSLQSKSQVGTVSPEPLPPSLPLPITAVKVRQDLQLEEVQENNKNSCSVDSSLFSFEQIQFGKYQYFPCPKITFLSHCTLLHVIPLTLGVTVSTARGKPGDKATHSQNMA